MKECPKCNAVLDDLYLYCSRCGANLQIPVCAHCKKELPEDACFCPWCGKPVTRKDHAEPEQVLDKTEVSAQPQQKVFSEIQQTALKQLLGKDGVVCTPEKVYWKESEDQWGAVDGSWTVYWLMQATPAGSDWKDRLSETKLSRVQKGMDSAFKKIADQSDKCLHYEQLDSHFTVIKHAREDGTIWWEQKVYVKEHIRMVVSNPCGTGMDVLVEYMHYDDNF